MSRKIEVIDRLSGKVFEEKIFGEKFVRWAHETSLGRGLTASPWIQKLASKAYGTYASSPFSRGEIPRFLQEHAIKLEDFLEPEDGFSNFNDFFSRRLRPGARTFALDPAQVLSPAEGRVFYSPIVNGETALLVKGARYPVSDLIGDSAAGLAHAYVIRLCPVDYHRYHFGFAGKILQTKKLGGKLFSVNPIALDLRNDIFWENHREVFKLQTVDHRIAYQIEVGAICVGSMTQDKKAGDTFKAGDDKGTFLFGGSTCILLLPQSFVPHSDIVDNSGKGFETYVRVGEQIGSWI